MKEDSFQDEKIPSTNNQGLNSSSVNDESLDWAKQAYLQLKQKQKDAKEISKNVIKEKEISNIDNTILN